MSLNPKTQKTSVVRHKMPCVQVFWHLYGHSSEAQFNERQQSELFCVFCMQFWQYWLYCTRISMTLRKILSEVCLRGCSAIAEHRQKLQSSFEWERRPYSLHVKIFSVIDKEL